MSNIFIISLGRHILWKTVAGSFVIFVLYWVIKKSLRINVMYKTVVFRFFCTLAI